MSILFNNGKGYGVNPTSNFLPYNNNGNFSDSLFNQDSNGIQTYNNIFNYNHGFRYIPATKQTWLGDFLLLANQTYLTLDDGAQRLYLSNNLKKSTAGLVSGQYLEVWIGSTQYKIALLNP